MSIEYRDIWAQFRKFHLDFRFFQYHVLLHLEASMHAVQICNANIWYAHCKTIYFGIFGLDMKHTQTYLKIIIQELNMI